MKQPPPGSMLSAWLHSASQLCLPLTACLDDKPRSSEFGSVSDLGGHDALDGAESLSQSGLDEKPYSPFHHQPTRVARPSAEPVRPRSARLSKKKHDNSASSHHHHNHHGSSFSGRRRFWSNASSSASSRRPQISAPSNFRHIYSQSFQFPPAAAAAQPRRRPRSFRPLELSIYLPDNHLSPILPHFDPEDHDLIAMPPPARLRQSFDDDSATLTHERSYSSMSFHLPRRPLRSASNASRDADEAAPAIPPRARGRARAYTSPAIDTMVERIASAMLEKEILQSEIDSVIERQSIYISSRPSTAYGMSDMEPMPSIPALPPAAPSFAERLSTERPQTAPSQSAHAAAGRTETSVEDTVSLASIQSQKRPSPRPTQPTRADERPLDRPLAPPLPLVLRPPLRKKKSFSRVSSWLFPGGTANNPHQRDVSLDTITNLPRPLTGQEGFYQCVAPPELVERTSIDTVSTSSGWDSSDEEGERVTTAQTTNWSPSSSMATKQLTPLATPSPAERRGALGRVQAGGVGGGPRPTSVGVAF